MNKIFQIYDSTFKRILTLSDKAVINLINGLFGTEHPTDSKITYNWTEYENKDLKRILADSILTINDRDIYHIEAQMTEDEEIVFRIFEYGFGHAYQNRIMEKDGETLIFPQPCVLYLDEGRKEKIQDEYTLTLRFKGQGIFTYKVPVVKLQSFSTEELSNKKMIILIPFFLLKLRKKLQKARTKENIEELQNLIVNDIMGSIEKNEKAGNISIEDAKNLRILTWKLYEEIYAQYAELEGVMRKWYDQSLDLESDRYLDKIDALEEELKEKNTEIENLKKRLEELQKK
ncbi:MAG: hypothetical protein KIG50_03545 [Lachnospiraceae bacterium]|nr:hypothetical protein [Lachnospiraceae bacterium]